jgi:hypothetical protein
MATLFEQHTCHPTVPATKSASSLNEAQLVSGMADGDENSHGLSVSGRHTLINSTHCPKSTRGLWAGVASSESPHRPVHIVRYDADWWVKGISDSHACPELKNSLNITSSNSAVHKLSNESNSKY